MGPTVQEDLHRIRTGEDGQPLDHGAGQKMGFVRLQNQVAASGHALALSTGTLERPGSVPTLERGNDQNGCDPLERSNAPAKERENAILR